MRAKARYSGPQIQNITKFCLKYPYELKPDTLAPKYRISNNFAWNTLTSTANHSASTNAMNKLHTYSKRSRYSPYFIFSGFNDQWKCRFSTDYVIAYRSSLYLSVDRCMTFECLNLFTPPPWFWRKKFNFDTIQLRDLCFINQKSSAPKKCDRKNTLEATR